MKKRAASKDKLSSDDMATLRALRTAADQLDLYDEAVRKALLAASNRGQRYPKPNLDSPLRLVIGSSR